MTPVLYDYTLSGSCYKVRLMAALLGVKLERIAVDFYPGGAHKQTDFLALNPAGTLPMLTADDLVLTDSAAILVWLARTYDDSGEWLPVDDPARLAMVQNWLAVASRLTDTSGAARLHEMLRKPCDFARAQSGAHDTLRILEAHLTKVQLRGGAYLLGDTPTIADIACFPYAALAPDGGVSLDSYPALRNWTLDIRTLPGFIEMPGIHPVHAQIDP